jgi:pyruvate/2-oxoglutarate dehydrogenase complex dihydrolipoamide dehydrogenase (E3) component
MVNIEGVMPGREVVILGSGDIGLIMARRMTLEGAKVKVVAELMPYSGGLKRNIVQCLNDFDIPLMLSHTVVDIKGKERVESVTIAAVDEKNVPIPGTEEEIPCDTLLLSCGLLPENELSRGMNVTISPVTGGPVVDNNLATNIDGVFACGNVLHVHDLVDYVSEEASAAGLHAAEYIKNGTSAKESSYINITATDGARYTVPAKIDPDTLGDRLTLRFRVGRVIKKCTVQLLFDDKVIVSKKRPVVAPGEMEELLILKKYFDENERPKTITVRIEES